MRRLALIFGLLLTALPFFSTSDAQGCGATAIRAGLTVRVRTGVNLRAAPGLNARDIGGLAQDDLATIIGGPACANDIKWWQIGGATPGWLAEASAATVYIEPAPVMPAQLRMPLEGLTISTVTATAVPPKPADQCPPLSGTVSVNFSAVADPLASGSEAAFFVEGGFGAPVPAICLPISRVQGTTLTAPNALVGPPQINRIDGVTDYVRATLPEAALLQPGVWRLTAADFTLDVNVIGPFGPLVDARAQDGTTTRVLLAGFAPSEEVALLGGDVTDGEVSNLRAVTVRVDAQGVAGADLTGFPMPIVAAVSQSGLIALPTSIQSLDLAGASNRSEVYDSLVIAIWGFEALGLPTPTPVPPTALPTDLPTPTAEATVSANLGTPVAAPTGIVNLSRTPTPVVATPTATPETDDGCTYTVRRGDTFFRIALNSGLTTAQLREANPQITNPQLIFAGTVLNIPGCGQGVS